MALLRLHDDRSPALDNLQECIEDVLRNGVPGDFCETGVWRDGSSIFMQALLKVHEVDYLKVSLSR